jgi:Mg2+ and Co2+ transporter CorA
MLRYTVQKLAPVHAKDTLQIASLDPDHALVATLDSNTHYKIIEKQIESLHARDLAAIEALYKQIDHINPQANKHEEQILALKNADDILKKSIRYEQVLVDKAHVLNQAQTYNFKDPSFEEMPWKTYFARTKLAIDRLKQISRLSSSQRENSIENITRAQAIRANSRLSALRIMTIVFVVALPIAQIAQTMGMLIPIPIPTPSEHAFTILLCSMFILSFIVLWLIRLKR